MKKFLLITACIFGTTIINAQIVIPDANFKAYLVGNASINTNMDTEIQLSEASSFNGMIDCNSLTITDLTGIEAFTALTGLQCYSNQLAALDVSNNTLLTSLDCSDNDLTTLDVSNNTSLTNLNCKWNQLTTLDISTNTLLTYLECGGNLLTSLDASNNTALTNLICPNNQLTSLNVSTNTALSYLNCQTNQLTTLDLSNNTALITLNCMFNQLTALNNVSSTVVILQATYNQLTSMDVSANTGLTVLGLGDNQLTSLNAKNGNNTIISGGFFTVNNNPALFCIEVDNAAYSAANWTYIDPGASFSEDCNASIENNELVAVSFYPNPATDFITVELGETFTNAKVEILNSLGQVISNQIISAQITTLQLPVQNGIYFIKLTVDNKTKTERFINQ